MVRKCNRNTQTIINYLKSKYGDSFDYSKTVYINATTKIIVICNICKQECCCLFDNIKKYRGCPKCSKKNRNKHLTKTNEQFLIEAYKKHQNKYTYLSKYINKREKIKIGCNTCSNEFWQLPGSHINGAGCRKCQYKNLPQNQRYTVDQFESLCKKIHGNKYTFFQDYTGNTNYINVLCNKCTRAFSIVAGELTRKKHRQQCPRCAMSIMETKICEYLDKYNIRYETQKTFSDCKNKRSLKFDFYLPDYNLCIEYNGEQHYKPVDFFGGNITLEKVKHRDQIKREYCLKQNIKLVSIFYLFDHQIEAIISHNLKNQIMFDSEKTNQHNALINTLNMELQTW